MFYNLQIQRDMINFKGLFFLDDEDKVLLKISFSEVTSIFATKLVYDKKHKYLLLYNT